MTSWQVCLLWAALAGCALAQNNNFNNNNGGFRPNNINQGQRFNNNNRFVPNNNFNNNNNNRFNNNNNNRFNNNNNNNRFNVPVNNNFNNNNNRFNVPVTNNGNNNNRFNNNFNNNNNNNFNNRNPVINGGFRATPANARDNRGTEVYPGCNGTVCLPEANLCAQRKQKGGHFTFGGKSYWISWASDERALRNARWNWFTGRNYCRKMCMDMVSFETQEEQNFVEGVMATSNVRDIHTAGRLCDAEVEGCNQTRFQPLTINGWFWASTLRMMPPTNLISNRRGQFNNWAQSGPNGRSQPDGAIKADGFGVEACMALINNQRFGGLKWHDEPCNNRRQLVCEDLPQPNINFVRNQNPNVNIP